MADGNTNEVAAESTAESAESQQAGRDLVIELRKTLTGVIDATESYRAQVEAEERELSL